MSLFQKQTKDSSADPTSIGNLLMAKGLIDSDQLKDLVSMQMDHPDLIGELCVARGYCTREQMDLVYLRQRELRNERVDYHLETTKLIDALSRRVRSLGDAFDEVRELAIKIGQKDAEILTASIARKG